MHAVFNTQTGMQCPANLCVLVYSALSLFASPEMHSARDDGAHLEGPESSTDMTCILHKGAARDDGDSKSGSIVELMASCRRVQLAQ